MAEEVYNSLKIIYAKYDGAKLEFQWELNDGQGYVEDNLIYVCQLIADGVAEGDAEEFCDEDAEQYYSRDFTPKDGVRNYSFQISLKEQSMASDTCSLVLCSFHDFSGVYQDGRFYFQWKTSGNYASGGCCTVKDQNGKHILELPVVVSKENAISGYLDYVPEGKLSAVLVASDGERCEGPDSTQLDFYIKGIDIHEASITDTQSTGSVSKKLELKIAYEETGGQNVRVVLAKNGRQIYCSDALEVAKSVDNDKEAVLSLEIPCSKVRYTVLTQSIVSCYYCKNGAESIVGSEQSELSLAIPKVFPQSVGSICSAKVSIDSQIDPVGFELSGNNTLVEEEGECSDTFMARARYDAADGTVRRGPSSSNAFPECFYADGDNIYYKGQSYSESSQSLSLSKDYFQQKITQTIEKGGLKLAYDDQNDEYMLTINTETAISTEDYQSFLSLVMTGTDGEGTKSEESQGEGITTSTGDKLMPKGFYQLCETILRAGAYKKSDTAMFQCRYSPENRTADVVPGLVLKMETAVYIPQYSKSFDNGAGLAWMNTEEVEVYFGNGLLEFDHFASGMLKHSSTSMTANAGEVVYSGGLMDLMRGQVRQPYYRILYPDTIPDPDTLSKFPNKNVALLAAGEYGSILDACSSISREPSAINYLSIPVILFHGRGMASLMTQVDINGVSCCIPVGATLEQVLAGRGIATLSGVKLFRPNLEGKELRVYGDLNGIMPLQGDRIEA